jgi:hypothetical protein
MAKLVFDAKEVKCVGANRRYTILSEDVDKQIKVIAAKTGKHKVDIADALLRFALKQTTVKG